MKRPIDHTVVVPVIGVTPMVPIQGGALVTLPDVESDHAQCIEATAFRIGVSGVGHMLFTLDELGVVQGDRLPTHRWPSDGDPGQPKGWTLLAPLADTLAGTIKRGIEMNQGAKHPLTQALYFESAMEGRAFAAAMLGMGS